MKRSVDNKEISTKLRKDKLNIINLKESNLTSTISDSKQKEKNNKLLKPKTATFRKIENIKLKGNQIKKIKIENDNNIKFLKNNLKKLNTEGDIIKNKKTNTKEIKENNINNTKNNRNDLTLKDKNQNRIKEITNINKINNDSYFNNKNIQNKYIRIIRQRISTYKKDKTKAYNNTCANVKNNISSFDKRKKYIVPIIKHKKKKKKAENKKGEKKNDIEKEKKIIENKEILTSNLIKNKQIEYLRDYQKYMDEFNNKLYKDNEKKFRFIQQEGFYLDNLFIDDENDDDNINDTIDEIYEKEEAEGDENQESI